jgi:Fe-S oxidoreductase
VFDPRDPKFYDQQACDAELRRVFQICHGCRLCFSFCPSFPELFARVDQHVEKGEGEADALTRPEIERVVDLCYQCKLCYVKCPYTPPHPWDVDFPRTVLRAKAARAQREGLTVIDRALGDPDRCGKQGSALPRLFNWLNRNPVVRRAVEHVVGVHRDRNLPDFHSPTYCGWHREREAARPRPDSAADSVAVFGTCTVNYWHADIGAALTQVLEKNGKQVVLKYENCCGMPWLDGGGVDRAVAQAEANVQSLAPLARQGIFILVPQPTCAYMLRAEYGGLLGTEAARLVAEMTLDPCEYLMKLHEQGELDCSFTRPQGRIAYHAPCHLRAQNIGLRAFDLLSLLPGTEVELVEKCSAFDGTWGMKKEFYPLSLKYAAKLNEALAEAGAERIASDCALAGLNVIKGLGRAPVHPIQILRDAYGLESPFGKRSGPECR